MKRHQLVEVVAYVAKRSMIIVFLIVTMLEPFKISTVAQAADGAADLTFGNGGSVMTDFSGNYDWITDVLVQSDGKILAVGGAETADDTDHFALARYNSDGSLDQSFGTEGKVIATDARLEVATSVAVLPEGKILVAGSAYDGGSDFGLARFNSDGSIDSSFGSFGTVITNLGGADDCSSVIVQPDGKILLAGDGGQGNRQASSFMVVRYKSDGRKDLSFGKGGVSEIRFSDGFDQAYAMALQPDGKIVLAGSSDSNNEKTPFAVARINSDGSLDETFGDGGKFTLNFFGTDNEVRSVALQSDGKILLAGWADRKEPGPEIFALARLNSNGSLDKSFGDRGKVTDELFGRGGQASAINIQPGGKIVVAGYAGSDNSAVPVIDFAVFRYNSDGTLDTSFGSSGLLITDLHHAFDFGNAMAFQPDGKIIVAGGSDDIGIESDFALVRYDNHFSYDICLQDDANGSTLQIDSATGYYIFTDCKSNFALFGRGNIKVKKCKVTLKTSAFDRSVSVTIKSCKHKASASVEDVSSGRTFSLSDSDTEGGTCACQ